jgi:CopG-like RHH_1 or ribbon-helix-helix domain, RHH_5
MNNEEVRAPEKIRTNIVFDPETLGQLSELCAEERRSRSNMVNWLIEQEYKQRHPEEVNGHSKAA